MKMFRLEVLIMCLSIILLVGLPFFFYDRIEKQISERNENCLIQAQGDALAQSVCSQISKAATDTERSARYWALPYIVFAIGSFLALAMWIRRLDSEIKQLKEQIGV